MLADNSSNCSSTSSQSSTTAIPLNQSDSSSSSSSLCGWCQKPGLKLFTLRTADGSKAFCSELCFTQCRRASFKKNKICNWCKHVRHTVNYVDYFDGKSQLQFCSTKCLGQYKMNILCREIEMIPPRVLQSVQQGSSPPPPTSPARVTNQVEAAAAASTQLPVDLCTKRKASCREEDESVKHEMLSTREQEFRSKKDANHALERSQVLSQDSTKRFKSHRKSERGDHKKSSDAGPGGAVMQSNGHEHQLRVQQQQIHLQQLQQQLQTRMSLVPEIMLRSLNGKQTAVVHERSCNGRKENGLESRSLALPTHAAAAPLLPHHHLHHRHLPSRLPPPPPLRNHHFSSFLRPASLLQHCSADSSLTLQRDSAKLARGTNLKSEPSASSHQSSSKKQQQDHAIRSTETPAEESTISRIRSHAASLPRPPAAAGQPLQSAPSLIVPMPVLLPFPLPIPVPLFFFQQKALEKIEQLALQMKRECRDKSGSRHEFEDKSTQVD